MKFLIEHMEPKLFKWCILEYTHISEEATIRGDTVLFTDLKNTKNMGKLKGLGKLYSESAAQIFKNNKFNGRPVRLCVLDLNAEKVLSKSDNNFDFVLLGGILGDFPRQNRTKGLLESMNDAGINYETRHLGKDQFSTDIALIVAQELLAGKKLSELEFVDEYEIEIAPEKPGECGESISLPFKYLIRNGKPVVAKGLIDLVKKQKVF